MFSPRLSEQFFRALTVAMARTRELWPIARHFMRQSKRGPQWRQTQASNDRSANAVAIRLQFVIKREGQFQWRRSSHGIESATDRIRLRRESEISFEGCTLDSAPTNAPRDRPRLETCDANADCLAPESVIVQDDESNSLELEQSAARCSRLEYRSTGQAASWLPRRIDS